MADTALQVVVSPFLGVVFDNLSSLIDKEFGMIWGVPKEMEKLSNTLTTIQNVLEDAEDKQLTNKAIANWLRKLKDAAYDADDVLDECAFEGLQLASEMISNSRTKQVTDFFKQMNLRRKMGKRIKRLNERFDAIAEERSKFQLTEGTVERTVEFCRGRETGSMFTERQFYGRDEDIENLVTLLVNDVSSQEDPSVCPVLGIGGLGKTTLVQLVFNDDRVTQHFEVKLWVCVSDDFDVKRLIKSIIISLSGDVSDLEELNHLQRRLQENLQGKRFLLVLDDVWNESQEEWNKLNYSLRCGAKGSSVIVTTRLQTVASITGTLPAYPLKGLSEDDCWSLFKQRAFGLENEDRPDLVAIGKEIVKKCGGVPLAAKALGGLMRFKREESEWLFVRDSEIWNLPQNDENKILPALKLSYNHLPSHLRQCFAYCAIYPKDFQISKKELLHLWIANGLVQSKGRMCLEYVANEIFNDLLWRSFFQDIEKDVDGDVSRCKMHDLVHDLACSITLNECSSVEVDRLETVDKRVRHLLLNSRHFPVSLPKVPPFLRTFLLMNGSGSTKVPRSAFSDLMYLRALDLSGSDIEEFPILTSNLKHLRYLNLSHTGIRSLPESICCLKNLQVLKLEDCYELERLPKHVSKMSSLRHLYIRHCFKLTHMPLGMGELVHLQTLSIFIVGPWNGSHIKELQKLDLGGELHIDGLEFVRSSADAREAKLAEKKNLRSLSLAWSDSCLQEDAAEVIEGLHPPPNIRRLTISGYGGVIFPSWLGIFSHSKLEIIFLKNCGRLENLPSFGQLPFLKVLHMSKLDSLKSIGNEFYGDGTVTCFPSLERLLVSDMPELEEWSSLEENGREIPMFPGLKLLIIEGCPKLSKIPLLLSVEDLTLEDCGRIENLPSFGQLPFLKVLRMTTLHSLKSISNEFYGDGTVTCFPSLEELVVQDMPELEEWSSLEENGREIPMFPWLKRLYIGGCPKLSKIPLLLSVEDLTLGDCGRIENLRSFGQLPFLKTLHMRKLDFLKSIGNEFYRDGTVTCFPSLEELKVEDMRELEEWSSLEENGREIPMFPGLKRLSIHQCPKLSKIPLLLSVEDLSLGDCGRIENLPSFGQLPFLKVLHMSKLDSLKSIGNEFYGDGTVTCFPSLEELEVSYMRELEEWSSLEENGREIPMFPGLKELYIDGCPKLTCLPEGLQHVSTLEYLWIYGCPGLKLLQPWLGKLTSLRDLDIENCYDMESIPEEMQQLTALQTLSIKGCSDELQRRCEKDKGEFWPYISHIPSIKITSETM